jgi:hypothetical protein
MGDWLGRRVTYFLLCVGSLAIVPAYYLSAEAFDFGMLLLAWLLGGITASFYGWLPLYLPELFRTPLRATGQGFSFNFGRVLAAIGVLQLGNLVTWVKGVVPDGGLPQVCSLLSLVYIAGMVLIWFMPETRGKPLPD